VIRIQQEFLIKVEKDIKPLILQHNQEVAYRGNPPLDPDWDTYFQIESQDKLRVFTARDDNKLVGYFVFILLDSLHYKGLKIAYHDLLFVLPEYRSHKIVIDLFQFAEKYLEEDGIDHILFNSTTIKPLDKLLERFGFTHTESVFIKKIS